ncbi:MAG: hypothetical protein OIN66_03265 [Candidatus Methanoperedens sp.]|nr:hypothetical protein [Candidatus Methanoperedens sp.]
MKNKYSDARFSFVIISIVLTGIMISGCIQQSEPDSNTNSGSGVISNNSNLPEINNIETDGSTVYNSGRINNGGNLSIDNNETNGVTGSHGSLGNSGDLPGKPN